MKLIKIAIFSGIMALMVYLIYSFDLWLGFLAYKTYYLTFAVLFAVGIVLLFRQANFRPFSIIAGVFVLGLLVSPYFFSNPSSRILRGVLIDVQPGTPAEEVAIIVQEAYENSGYEMPIITPESSRIHVSLRSQSPGDVTAAIFQIENGLVVSDSYSPD